MFMKCEECKLLFMCFPQVFCMVFILFKLKLLVPLLWQKFARHKFEWKKNEKVSNKQRTAAVNHNLYGTMFTNHKLYFNFISLLWCYGILLTLKHHCSTLFSHYQTTLLRSGKKRCRAKYNNKKKLQQFSKPLICIL